MGDGAGSEPPWAAKPDAEPEPEPEPVPEPALEANPSAREAEKKAAPSEPAEAAEPKPKKKNSGARIFTAAVEQSLSEGQSERVVREWLAKKGVAEAEADATIARARASLAQRAEARTEALHEAVQEAERAQKRKNLVVGGLWFGGGLILTIGTYSAASGSPSGGSYLIAWGPMIYGVIRLLRAL